MSETVTPVTPPPTERPSATPPHADDTGELQEGDFGLDGDLRTTMLAALESVWNPDDPGATTLPDDAAPAAGASQPDPATPPTGVDAGGAGAGVGGETGGGAAPEPTPSIPAPTTPATDAEFSLDQYARDYFGTDLNPAQARELFGVLNGLQQLSPEQRAHLDQTLAGGQPYQYPATTGYPAGPPTQYPPAPAPQSPPGPPQIPGLPPRPDDEFQAEIYDRMVAPLAQATQAQLADMQANLQRTTAMQLAREQADINAQIEAAATSWRVNHPLLTDGEYDSLIDRITRSGTFAPLVATHGSPHAATTVALDQFFWGDPNLRARALANAASGRLPGDPTTPDPSSPLAAQQAEIEKQRQARAAAVAGGGGRAVSPGTPAPAPTDKAGRKAAMIAALAANGEFAN